MTRNDEVPQEVGDALAAHDAAAAAVPGSRRHAEWRAIRDYLTTLRAKLEAAEGEVARLREDARRYRWLREQNAHLESPDAWTITRCDFTDEEAPNRYWVGSDLDAAIDAALGGNANA